MAQIDLKAMWRTKLQEECGQDKVSLDTVCNFCSVHGIDYERVVGNRLEKEAYNLLTYGQPEDPEPKRCVNCGGTMEEPRHGCRSRRHFEGREMIGYAEVVSTEKPVENQETREPSGLIPGRLWQRAARGVNTGNAPAVFQHSSEAEHFDWRIIPDPPVFYSPNGEEIEARRVYECQKRDPETCTTKIQYLIETEGGQMIYTPIYRIYDDDILDEPETLSREERNPKKEGVEAVLNGKRMADHDWPDLPFRADGKRKAWWRCLCCGETATSEIGKMGDRWTWGYH